MLKLKEFIVIDFKTTGFDGSEKCISGTVIDQDGCILIDTLIKPSTHTAITPIEHFHDITQDQIDEEGITYSDFLGQLTVVLEQYTHIMMYNAEYDKKFISSDLLANKKVYCVMLLSLGFINNNPVYQAVNNYLKLNNVAALLDINYFDVNLLTSLGDAELCRRVWLHISGDQYLETPFCDIVQQYFDYIHG